MKKVLELLKDKDVLLNIEVKTGLGFEQLNEQLVQLLDRYDFWERTIISSFNHYALAHLVGLKPQARTAILYTAALVNPGSMPRASGPRCSIPIITPLFPKLSPRLSKTG